MSEETTYEVLFAKERRVEVSGDSADDVWKAAEEQRSGDERIVSIEKKEKDKK